MQDQSIHSAENMLQRHDKVGEILSKQIFFVVGCQKSGTTWVQRLLDGHGQIICRGEAAFAQVFIPNLQNIHKQFNQQQQYRNAQLGEIPSENQMEENDLVHLFATMAATMMAKWANGDCSAVKCIGEKTPEHAMCLPLLAKAFPKMKVIHVIRDGRDVAVSGWHHNLRFNKQKFQQQFPTFDLYLTYLLKNHWLSYIQNARVFGQTNPRQYFEVKYEDLHADSRSWTEQLLGFLDVDVSEDSVNTCVESGSFKKQSEGRDQGQENRESFFRKGVVGDWRSIFDARTLATFMQLAGPMMKQLGYDMAGDAAVSAA